MLKVLVNTIFSKTIMSHY